MTRDEMTRDEMTGDEITRSLKNHTYNNKSLMSEKNSFGSLTRKLQLFLSAILKNDSTLKKKINTFCFEIQRNYNFF
jgi:hypothetical protein